MNLYRLFWAAILFSSAVFLAFLGTGLFLKIVENSDRLLTPPGLFFIGLVVVLSAASFGLILAGYDATNSVKNDY